ncbi:hypothetical protein THMIRHAM_18490 [Thiomicrorhabdus immobilis]|uniref:Uncharacterized protein n=1 Tax=Thiomicrorhabdus immobilis TaxID=2791037 RepID=A0ABM7MF32_9GAMM|nr:YihY family inner membrane protein [Thiomicrorhabdus immobilis]BCN94064.1 hypothetical protein THMIRHAM_18490 [Thiomicrorhabdus immobilis]
MSSKSSYKQKPQAMTMLALLKQVADWHFWKQVFLHFKNRQGTDAVAILAYTSLVGIVPMLAVMLGLFSVSSYFASFENLVMEQVVRNLMPNSQPVIEEYLFKFSLQAASLKGPGLVVMLFTTLMLLWKVDQKLNGLWSERLERKWWVSLLHYLGISLLGPLLLGMSLVLSSSLLALPLIVDTTPLIDKLTSGMKIVPLVLAWLGFTALYKLVPVAKVPFKVALLSGLFAMLQLELLKTGFALYVEWFPTYAVVYGAFAAVPLFLLWLYLVWFIVIWNGAVVVTLLKMQIRENKNARHQAENQLETENSFDGATSTPRLTPTSVDDVDNIK